jgi:Cu/Ag efflux protein CusF
MRLLPFVCAFAVLSLGACSSERGPLPAGTLAENQVSVTARVEKLDLKARKVALRLPDGTLRNIVVPEEVRNLPQVKVGDQVVAQFYESVAFEVKPAGSEEPGVSVASGGDRAELGAMPAAIGAQAVTVTTTITGIDKRKGTVTLTGPDGESFDVKVRNPANLDRVDEGDLVDITYTEALAVSVERVAEK